MAIQKKTLPAKKLDKAETPATAPKSGKPSADVNASDAVTPSLIVSM